MIDQMSDFIKGRTTVTSRIEEVESLEPPTVTICMNPPYKSSKLALFGLEDNFGPMFDQDYNNKTLEERIDIFSRKLGQDFQVNMQLDLGMFDGSWNVSVGLGNIGNFTFEVQPIVTILNGKCYKIQPKFRIALPDFRLSFQVTISSLLEEVDVPTSIVFFMTSHDTWQGITTNIWPQYSPSRVEIDRSEWPDRHIYTTKPTEYRFDQGIESSEDCFLRHILMSDCKSKCVFASFAPLPLCHSIEASRCISQESRKANLGTICNQKKHALTYPGDITKVSATVRNPSSHTLKRFQVATWSFLKQVKEEIKIITLPDLIGSLGGSLGMFFGFSISAYMIYLLDKCIMKAMVYRRTGVTPSRH